MVTYTRMSKVLALSIVVAIGAASTELHAQNAEEQSLRVGLYQNKPKLFRDHRGHPAGFFVEILEAMSAEEGWAIEYVDCHWKQCLEMLDSGQLDLMPDVALSPERARRFDFHDVAVVDSFSRVYAPSSAQFERLSDLAGKRMAVLEGSVQQDELRTKNNLLDDKMELVVTDSFDDAFARVADGKADGAVTSGFHGDASAGEYDLAATPIVIRPSHLFFAAPKGSQADQLAAIDRYLNQWQRDELSVYYSALRKWTGGPTPERASPWLVYVLWGGLGVLLVAALAIVVLRRQVAMRTRHLDERNDELRENQRHLAQSEARAKRIIQGLPIATAVWRATDRGPALESMNDAAIEMVAPTRPSPKGTKLDDLYASDHPIRQMVEECFETEKRKRVEVRTPIFSGDSTRTLVITCGFLEPGTVLLHIEDITEQVQLQQKLQVTQRLETAGLLASGVAHDFNNLLTVITSNAELALSEIDDDSLAYEDVQIILDSAKKAAAITGQLLAFSRNEDIEPKLLSLSKSVAQLADMLGHFVNDNISLEINARGKDDLVYMDPTQVERIVMNLVLNARDAIRGKGTIHVSTRVDVGAAQAILEVSDTGRGMDEETASRVFEPFFTTKAKDRGTGLGLATVYGAVTQVDGTIDLVSEPGEGTTFTIALPLSAADQPAQPASPEPAPVD
ncbi:MAG: ATP-binding protein [Persicimonas sp.]